MAMDAKSEMLLQTKHRVLKGEKKMKTRRWPKVGLIFVLAFTLLFLVSFNAPAEEAKYLYDDLGRLFQVIDSQGNAATYNYDAVGNLLSITRSTGALAGPEITAISPDSAREGDTVDVTISGNHLLGAAVRIANPEINVTNVRATEISISARFSLSLSAPLGPTTVTISNVLGTAQISFTVNPPSSIIINAISTALGSVGTQVDIYGSGFDTAPSGNLVSFNGVTAPVYSSTESHILTAVPSGATSGPLTVTTIGGTSNGINFTVLYGTLYTKSLLHFDAMNGSNFIDETGKVWSSYWGAELTTTQKKFGTASLLITGDEYDIGTPPSPDLDLSNNDWTVEFWLYFDESWAEVWFEIEDWDYSTNEGTGSLFEFGIDNYGYSDTQARVHFRNGFVRIYGPQMPFSTPNTGWHHFALVRNGHTVTYYVDGISLGSDDAGFDMGELGWYDYYMREITAKLTIEPNYWGGEGNFRIDEFRLSNGIARWTSNFTPPSAPYTLD